MTRIDFYQIEGEEPPLLFACRLIEKIYRRGHRVHVQAASQSQAEELDDLLWSFRAERFIPHALLATAAPVDAPIHIGAGDEPADHQEVMVNLSGVVPDFFSRFDRVAEVVPREQNSRDEARANYRFYKDRGYPLQYHRMNQQDG